MKFEFSFAVGNEKVTKEEKQRKAKLTSSFPIIEVLRATLRNFENSCYSYELKNTTVVWVEDIIIQLYSSDFSEKEINAFIKNFEWYNSVLQMFLTNQELLQNNVFGLKTSKSGQKYSPVKADVKLITDILNMCNKEFGQTVRDENAYKKRINDFARLKKAHKYFIKVTAEYIEDISDSGLNHAEYIATNIEPVLSNMLEIFEKDIVNTKPYIPDVFSQKLADINRALTIAVIKMVNSYMEKYYNLKNEKNGKLKMMIPLRTGVLVAISNSLLGILENVEMKYFDENKIKGILRNQ